MSNVGGRDADPQPAAALPSQLHAQPAGPGGFALLTPTSLSAARPRFTLQQAIRQPPTAENWPLHRP
jgi:hypothetical protein